jgi:hypothetical protein
MMFYNILFLNYNFYNIKKIKKDITEKVPLVVLHGLATIDGSPRPAARRRQHPQP